MIGLRRNSSRNSDKDDNELVEGDLVADTSSTAAIAETSVPAVKTPSYPDLAYKAFGSRGETLVKIGIAAIWSLPHLPNICSPKSEEQF